MPQTIRFTLNLEALVKLRDAGSCKFKMGEQEYQIVIDEELDDNGIFLDPFEDELDHEEEIPEEELEHDPSEDQPGPEFYPPIEDKKDYT